MKIFGIGLGQCGCNVVDEFCAMNRVTRSILGRSIEVVTNTIAINTDETDLGSFRHIPKDRKHRVLVGRPRTYGHGVGKINTEGARIIRESESFVVDTILNADNFSKSDAVVLAAGGAGGTGAGAIGWLAKFLKSRIDKPIYSIIVLPFKYEERGDTSYAVTNTATCLKTVIEVSDAVFLLDNQQFSQTDESFGINLREINRRMVGNFLDLLCAGEEQDPKYVGSKVMDAGDIRQSLEGVTTIGRGIIHLPFFPPKRTHFKQEMKESSIILEAIEKAVGNLCLPINLYDARKILALVVAPRKAITLTALEEIATYLETKCPKAIVRIGDYPQKARAVSVTLLASKLTKAERLESIYIRGEKLLDNKVVIEEETEREIRTLYEMGKRIPGLEQN